MIVRVAQSVWRHTQQQKHKSTKFIRKDVRDGGVHSSGKVWEEYAECLGRGVTVGCTGRRGREERKLMRQKVSDEGGRGRPALRKRNVKVDEIVEGTEHKDTSAVQAQIEG